MLRRLSLLIFLPGICLMAWNVLPAQEKDVSSYVDPFIGTAKSDVYTKWGNEGGTYPGAVAPWGYLQLTPETRMGGGYDHTDSTIFYFSCIHHMSGYPGGSQGRIRVMPVSPQASRGNVIAAGERGRPFLHKDEKAIPGYYCVRFSDDHTLAEATASERVGLFRFTFPPGVAPAVFVGGIGAITRKSLRELQGAGIPAVLQFSGPITGEAAVSDGSVLTFSASTAGPTVIVLAVSVSPVGITSAEKNIVSLLQPETGGDAFPDFDRLKKETRGKWRKELAVISVDDVRVNPKKIFYTALYHAMLVPWIISDVEGHYRGADGRIHTVSGKDEYGAFSPWDTFRSLHPLLTLLFPERQRDMIRSMLDVARETGHLPTDPMTGDHAVAILVDSYGKGIRGFDRTEAYAAMRKSLMQPPFAQPDRSIYRQLGYIPASYPESVTRTVEYAYDDWALAQFARQVMHREADGDSLQKGGYGYRYLLDPEELFLLPREGDRFRQRPGTTGYKEGDQWVYTYFAPQHPKDLVNLLGGDRAFTERLDSELVRQDIVFDNETVFHIPYLFNYSGRPDKTQEWIGRIRDGRFAATPGGLPGNDDLGAMSSWYVFSALGFLPVCPGRPVYDIGTPGFRSVTLHLPNGRRFVIRASGLSRENKYIRSLSVNHHRYNRLTLPHSLIVKGGGIDFTMCSLPGERWARDDVGRRGDAEEPGSMREPDFIFSRFSVSKEKVAPDELFEVRFSLRNRGATGTRIVQLSVNGRPYADTHCLVTEGATVAGRIACRLYPFGKARLKIAGLDQEQEVEVVGGGPGPVAISGLSIKPVLKMGETQTVSFSAQNTGGIAQRYMIPVLMNDVLVRTDSLVLGAGEKRTVSLELAAGQKGLQTIGVKDVVERFKVYGNDTGSLILDLSLDKIAGDSLAPDGSGFGNAGRIIRSGAEGSAGGIADSADGQAGILLSKDCYVEIPNAPSLDRMGGTITMMAWVYPVKAGDGSLVDIFTKGDNHVLQVAGNRSLTFFAGGWGRGDCTVDLPADWLGHWHHIAGVCTGSELRLYIDGKLKGTAEAAGRVNLSVTNKWTLGRNEEFPGQRVFNGYMEKVKVFSEPLTQEEIGAFVRREEKR